MRLAFEPGSARPANASASFRPQYKNEIARRSPWPASSLFKHRWTDGTDHSDISTYGHQTQTLFDNIVPRLLSMRAPLHSTSSLSSQQLRITCVQFFTVSLSGSSPLLAFCVRLLFVSRAVNFLEQAIVWGLGKRCSLAGEIRRGSDFRGTKYLTRITEGKTGARRNHLFRENVDGERGNTTLFTLAGFRACYLDPYVDKGIETLFRCKRFWTYYQFNFPFQQYSRYQSSILSNCVTILTIPCSRHLPCAFIQRS